MRNGMGLKIFLLILCLNLGIAFAQEEMSTSASKPKKVKRVRKHWHAGLSYGFWSESLKTTKGSSKAKILSQFHGFTISGIYNKSITRNWRQAHAVELSFGTVKGKGDTPAIQDELRNHLWQSLALSPGLMYQTSPVSEVGFAVPVVYRLTHWKLNAASNLDIERDNTFSVGFSLFYANRLTNDLSLRVAVTQQHMWNATQWSLGAVYAFR